MGAYKRAMLAAQESQPWDATEYLRDELVIDLMHKRRRR